MLSGDVTRSDLSSISKVAGGNVSPLDLRSVPRGDVGPKLSPSAREYSWEHGAFNDDGGRNARTRPHSSRSNTNKMHGTPTSVDHGATRDVSVPPQKSPSPRSNGNKISARGPPPVRSEFVREDSLGATMKMSPGRSPRGELRGSSPRASPSRGLYPASPRGGVSLADIKAELLGPEMRRLIREEMTSVLSDGPSDQSKISAARVPNLAVPVSNQPRTSTQPMDASTNLKMFLEGTENRLGLSEKRAAVDEDTGEPSPTVRRAGTLSSMKANPLNVYKSVMTMLEVTDHEHITGWDRFTLRLQHRLNSLGTQYPPPRTDCLSRIADSLGFDIAVHIVIVFNVACMAVQADLDIRSPNSDAKMFFRVAEVAFVCFYSFEFVVKFARARWMYFYGQGYGWNLIDFIVLVFSIPFALQIDGAMDALPGKIIRVLRLTRALRVLQLVTFFKKLKALLHSLTASVSTLVCSMSMIMVFLFMFSLFFVMRVAQVIKYPGSTGTQEEKDELLDSFGSILLSMLTLWQACTGGRDWNEVFTVLGIAGWESQTIFVGFTAFSQMALLNIVLGMFVEQAMKSMASDKLELAHRHFQEQSEFRKTIQELFDMAGMARESQTITHEEWRRCSQKHRLYSFLDFHGFQPNEVDQYFELLCNASGGEVDVNHFVNGCMRMKGGASSFSVYEVLLAISELEGNLLAHLGQVESQLGRQSMQLGGAISAPSVAPTPRSGGPTPRGKSADAVDRSR